MIKVRITNPTLIGCTGTVRRERCGPTGTTVVVKLDSGKTVAVQGSDVVRAS